MPLHILINTDVGENIALSKSKLVWRSMRANFIQALDYGPDLKVDASNFERHSIWHRQAVHTDGQFATIAPLWPEMTFAIARLGQFRSVQSERLARRGQTHHGCETGVALRLRHRL